MMFETTSEDTPISPAFKTKTELVNWLVKNKVEVFGSIVGHRQDWEAIVNHCSSGAIVVEYTGD